MVRKIVHPYLPSHYHKPHRLLLRILQSGSPEAIYTVKLAALGLIASPFDYFLGLAEKRLYENPPKCSHPNIFVVGPPRSGTTLVGKTLIKHLPVSYFNNLTALFPRAPIAANQLFPGLFNKSQITYTSYYGRTRTLSGPNDALYVWDRWFGKDRSKRVTQLGEKERVEMQNFFRAYQAFSHKPLVAKNNNLLFASHLVADTIDRAHFICVVRDPLYLAQSLLQARRDIHGDDRIPYGIVPEGSLAANPIESVCEQVRFFEGIVKEQQELVGRDRFWVVSYEDFCRNPREIVERVRAEIVKQTVEIGEIEPFTCSARRKIPENEFETLKNIILKNAVDNGL